MKKLAIIFLLGFFVCNGIAQQADSLFNLGKNQFEIGNYKEAINYFKQTLQLQQNYKGAHYICAMAEYNLKHYDRAIVYFNNAITQNTLNSNAYLFKAISYKNLKNSKQALNTLNIILKTDSLNPLLLFEKASVFLSQKKYKVAIPFYQQTLALNANLEKATNELGLCYYYLYNKIKACEYWSKLNDPDDFENYELIIKTCHNH